MLGNMRAGGGGNRGWDGWMASLTQQIWVWANSRRWWNMEKPSTLQSMGSQSQTQLSDWTTNQFIHFSNWDGMKPSPSPVPALFMFHTRHTSLCCSLSRVWLLQHLKPTLWIYRNIPVCSLPPLNLWKETQCLLNFFGFQLFPPTSNSIPQKIPDPTHWIEWP